MAETPNRLLRPAEVVPLVGLSRASVYAAIRSGVLPSVRLGKSVRVPSAALDAWITASTRGGEPDRAA